MQDSSRTRRDGRLEASNCVAGRRTWARWHKKGWSNAEMVRRYAHLSAEHLAEYAERLRAFRTNPGTAREEGEKQLAGKLDS